MSIADLRREYSQAPLLESDVDADPFRQFHAWLEEALTGGLAEPNAMILATVSADGQPSARTVLLRGLDDTGFVFYTNYDSRKGRELAENPRAALVFYWPELQRQVRIEGTVERISPEESDQYWQTRPRDSQLGAWASAQSAVLPNRGVLEERFREVEKQYEGRDVPRPPNWGGYRVRPTVLEFWQGRPGRLHDRLCYRRLPTGGWKIERLAP
jgi:pyridoxamine 5'-phosphate oxidase